MRVGKAYKCPPMSNVKVLVHKSFDLNGVWTRTSWSVHHGIARWLGGEFCEKMKVVEGWKGLQMSPNEYHEILGARKFSIRRGLHMAKVLGAPRHS